MSTEHFYEVNVTWNEGRIGTLTAPEIEQSFQCATPPEFPQGIAGYWSPEHLYAAAINSCFMATFLAISENYKLQIIKFTCKTVCKLEKVEGRYLITKAVITPSFEIEDSEQKQDVINKVLDKSKAACLVTNSMKTEVELTY